MTEKLNIDRLANVVAMLASPNDGERANAAVMATRMLADVGISWRDLIYNAFGEGAYGQPNYVKEAVRRADVRSDEEEAAEAYRDRQANAYDKKRRMKEYHGVKATHLLRALKLQEERLTSWEKDFVKNLDRQNKRSHGLTEKQWIFAVELAQKIGLLPKTRAA